MKSIFPFSLLAVTLICLSACGDTRQSLGLGRNPPDEFAVVERPPLSMPPDFGLRPPRPGAPRPQSVDTSQQASEMLFNGNAPMNSQSPSEGERALLVATGAAKVDPNIRDVVDKETAQKASASPHLVDRVMNWTDSDKPAVTVDPETESARIKSVQDANEPINKGATPIIEKRQSGWLGL